MMSVKSARSIKGSSHILSLILLAVLFCFPSNHAEAGSLRQKCVKAKLKATGRHARDISRCMANAARNNDFGLGYTACLSTADAKAQSKIGTTTVKMLEKGQSCTMSATDLLLTGPTAWFRPYVESDLFPPVNSLPNDCVRRRILALGKYADKAVKCITKDYLRPDETKLQRCQQKAIDKLVRLYTRAGSCSGSFPTSVAGVATVQAIRQLDIVRFGPKLIDSPVTGSCTTDNTIAVTGRMQGAEEIASLTLNGIPQTLDGNFVYNDNVALDPGIIFNPISAEATTPSGDGKESLITVLAADGINNGCVADGDLSPESIAMRLNESGLDSITPLVSTLAGGALDIGPIIQSGNPVLDDECVAYLGALCLYWATVNIEDVSFSDFGINIDPISGSTILDVAINDFDVDIDLFVHDCCAVSFNCGLTISADAINIESAYDMVPDATNPSKVDVNQIGALNLSFNNFSHNFTSGICDAPIIGDIIDSLVGGTLQDLVSDGFAEALVDPDGAGPADSPIADGIETALDGIDIAGPVGQAIGVELEAEFSQIAEDDDGITFRIDAGVVANQIAPLAPDLPASYTVAESFPNYGPTTPNASPYGIGLGLSSTAFNQLLKAQVEGGLMQADITEIDFGGTQTLTAGLMSLFIPELGGVFAPTDQMVVEIRPGMSPVFTGDPGANGELAELRLGHLNVNITHQASAFRVLGMVVEAAVGVDLVIDPAGVGFSLGAPAAEDISVNIIENNLDTNEATVQALLSSLLPSFFPELAGALDGLPLPAFLGLELDPVEVSKQGDFITVFTDLVVPTP